MQFRNKQGATLGLAVALLLTVVLLGLCFFYLARILGGGKQCGNSTDAGALTAARSILAVGVPKSSVAPEFQGLGLDRNTGKPDPANGILNIFAYNRAAGVAALVAMNAVEENTPVALQNAEGLIISQPGGPPALNDFGNALNTAIITSGQLGNQTALDFKKTASENNINMMGPKATTQVVKDLDFKSVTTGTGVVNPLTNQEDLGKANVYFNSAIFADPNLIPLAAPARDLSGTIKSVALPDTNALSYEQSGNSGPFQSGQPLISAYRPINIIPGGKFPIYFAAVNPASQPHLIDAERFNNGTAQFGSAPVNCVQGQTLTTGTNKSNTNISAMACAVVGSIFNQYPIAITNGYVRIHNLPDARVANTDLNGLVNGVDASNNIFNTALYPNPPGGGGIYSFAASTPSNGAYDIFCTVYSGGANEAIAYAAYNASAKVSGEKDSKGRLPALDPTDGLGATAADKTKFADTYKASAYAARPYYPPNSSSSLHCGSGSNQLATFSDLLGINTANAIFCNEYSYDSPVYDNGNASGIAAQDAAGVACFAHLPEWASNFDNSYTGKNPALGQYTNLEAAKAEVLTYLCLAIDTEIHNPYQTWYTYNTAGQFNNPSGSKLYQRTGKAYATPSNVPSCAFGTVGTPYALLEQLYQNGSSCVNPDDAKQWNDPTSLLGRMLLRCKEICPSTDWTIVKNLLSTNPIPLGAYQYIYSPDGGLSLTIANGPPNFLNSLPEYKTPGTTIPDGPLLANCQDSNFTGAIGNIVDAAPGVDGNINGDGNVNAQPFSIYRGQINTSDFTNFQSSSGRYDLLGQLEFGNVVDAKASFWVLN